MKKKLLWILGLVAAAGLLVAAGLVWAEWAERRREERCSQIEARWRVCMRECAAKLVARRRAMFGKSHYVCSMKRWAACSDPCCPEAEICEGCGIDCSYEASIGTTGPVAGRPAP
ncbi:MAG: hypothetical protein JXR96_16185 [Deltaproteobacteria bacterium]|nr:hypothetical protein [Deltaproteobacteria bacterium]